jgi:hypothetical protein
MMKTLVEQLSSKNSARRLGVLRTIKNIAMDSKYHDYLLSSELGAYTTMLLPFIPPSCKQLTMEEKSGMPVEWTLAIDRKAKVESSVEVRMVTYETIMLLLRTKDTRVAMKASQLYHILKEMHKWEKALPDFPEKEDFDDMFENHIMQYLLIDEDEVAAEKKKAEEEKMEKLQKEREEMREAKKAAEQERFAKKIPDPKIVEVVDGEEVKEDSKEAEKKTADDAEEDEDSDSDGSIDLEAFDEGALRELEEEAAAEKLKVKELEGAMEEQLEIAGDCFEELD